MTRPMHGFAAADWVDTYGHYWTWNPTRHRWDHTRGRCVRTDGKACEGAT